MHVVAVDPEQGRAILAARDFVRRPQFVDQGAGFAHVAIAFALAAAGLSRVRNIVC